MTFTPRKPSERPLASPRRVRNGISLKSAGEVTGRGWLAQGWRQRLEAVVPPASRRAGLEYARRGQTTTLQVSPGAIDAEVQGRAPRPYSTRWRMPVLDEHQWYRLVEAMATEAFYAAKLLTNELPAAVEELFASLDLHLLPPAEQITVECDCGFGGPCKHAAAVGYLLVERLDQDPVTIFALRGMPRILERLGAARALRSDAVAAAHADSVVPDEHLTPPLESCLDGFWRPGPQLADLQTMPPPQHAPHALLLRLGPSPLPGRFPLVGLLASVYDTVAESALKLRDRAERLG